MTRTPARGVSLACLALAACGGDDGSAESAARAARAPAAPRRAAPPRRRPCQAGAPLRRAPRDDAWSSARSTLGQRPAGSPQLRRLAVELRKQLPAGQFEAIPGHPRAAQHRRHDPGAAAGDRRRRALRHRGRPEGLRRRQRRRRRERPRSSRSRARCASSSGPRGRAGAPLRALRRRGGARPDRRLLPRRAARLEGLRRRARERAQGADPARLRRQPRRSAPARATARRSTCGRACARRQPRRARATSSQAGRAAGIIDDHTPFLRAGIPAVDLIDCTYKYADTLQDTLDKLVVASLDAVGETVVELLRAYR